MCKTYSLVLLISILVSAGLPAKASAENQSNWYLVGTIGWSDPKSSDLSSGGIDYALNLDDSPIVSLAGGREHVLGPCLSLLLEAEFLALRHDISSYSGTAISTNGDPKITAGVLMANTLVRRKLGAVTSIYAGIGVGMGAVDFDTIGVSESDNSVWSYQFLTGISIRPEWLPGDVVLGYRYLGMEDTVHRFGELQDYASNSISLGFRYQF